MTGNMTNDHTITLKHMQSKRGDRRQSRRLTVTSEEEESASVTTLSELDIDISTVH